MKIGFLSDAHGNPTAMAACLQQLKHIGVDRIHFLGDAVGYLPGESEVFALLRASGALCQKGNHEAMLLGELPIPVSKDRIYQLAPACERLSAEDREFIASWPDHRVIEIEGRSMLLVHGAPSDYLQGYIYPDSDLQAFDNLDYDAVFMGHTHYPFLCQRPGILVVNVGSCGLPRDQGDLLSFAVYDTRAHHCEVLRLEFAMGILCETYRSKAVAQEVYNLFARQAETPFGQRINRIHKEGSE
jgi:putative phosphoesterase